MKTAKSFLVLSILRDLKAAGINTSEKRCARIVNERGIRGRKKHRRKPRTTDSRHRQPVAPNLLPLLEKPGSKTSRIQDRRPQALPFTSPA